MCSATSCSCWATRATTHSSPSLPASTPERFAGSDRPGLTSADVALFEPLVRATGRDEDALARVASLVEELRELPNGHELVPDGFDELWDVVWQVHQERRA